MPRHLQSIIHSEKSISGSIWSGYNQQIIDLWNSVSGHGDFNDHLIREYNRKIDLFNQPTSLFFAPYDAGYRFIGSSLSLTISGFAYPDETLTAPSGSSYQWYVNNIARGTAQTLTLTVNDIGLPVRCVVGAAECTPVTVWHPRDIANVKNFWWAAQGAYNTLANNVTDANARLFVSIPTDTFLSREVGNDQNGKAAYYSNVTNSYGIPGSTWCYWDGTQWVLNVFYDPGDNPSDNLYYSSDDTTYPWQATSWTGSQTVTRQVTTYDVLATDGQTVVSWRDIISGLDVTASSSNIALFEETDLATTSLKFDSTDYFTIPVALRTVFNSQNYGYIFAGVKDTAPTAGDATHGVVSINRTFSFAKVALATRIDGNITFTASTGPNSNVITSATVLNDSNYNVLTNEAMWADGEINLRINGDLAASETFTPAIPNNTTTASYIGADGSPTASNFNGYMTAIILATDLMSDTDRNRIERFIGLLGASNRAYDISNVVLFEEPTDVIPDGWTNSNSAAVASVDFKSTLTSIGSYAFYNCSSLASITIPNSVTSIGTYVFSQCTSLTTATIGSGVTSIGDAAFEQCTSLTSITIPNSVTSIGGYMFNGCTSLTTATIGSGVTSIGVAAFASCSDLTSITIPDSVTSISDETFVNCSALTSITIPNSVTSIGSFAFQDCTGLTSATIGSGVTSLGIYAFANSGLTSITIPNSVTSIGSSAFDNCSSLATATIGSGVTSISNATFVGCSALTSITIPNSVTSIGDSAFQDCIGLTTATIGSGVTSIGLFAFDNCTSLTSITIPNSVTSIGSGAFSYCSGLTTATIGSGVTIIEAYAFASSGLTSITIPNSVTSIGSSAFYGCSGLTSATIGSGVTSIGAYAFSTSDLTSITIPNSVTSMGGFAFGGCSSLGTLNCYVTRTIMNQSNVLLGTATPFTIYARATDATWTAGADTIGGKSVTVVKNL